MFDVIHKLLNVVGKVADIFSSTADIVALEVEAEKAKALKKHQELLGES